MSKDKLQYHLLHIIRYNGRVDDLLTFGLEYSQIADRLRDAVQAGYVSRLEGTLALTHEGELELKRLAERNFKDPTALLIKSETKSRISERKTLKRFDIYLPDKDNLDF